MTKSHIQRNIELLIQLLKSNVAERYKRLAREEKLSRFVTDRVDPALLVDLHLQIERQSVELTEMSLLELVTTARMNAELDRSARRIQQSFQEVYGEDLVPNFLSDALVERRVDCLRARVEFYNPLLVVTQNCENSLQLASKAFARAERFQKKLELVSQKDRQYNDELVRETEATHRFLMRKQTDYEVLKSDELWLEFKSEAFKKPQALP